MRLAGVFSLILLFILNACNSDNFDSVTSTGDLVFSSDTIYLDTVFTNTSSSTRTLKVYNKSGKNIRVPVIKLGLADQSFYRINVDGVPGPVVKDIDILAKDSIFIFIEATIDYSKVSGPLYEDAIVFESEKEPQQVALVTLVQDAHFLYPKKDAEGIKETIVLGENENGEAIEVEGFYLSDNTTWNNERPYVVYGFVGVPGGKTLTLEKGTRVHFHKNSGMLVDKGATVKMQGEAGKEIILEGDRLEPSFSNVAGQWSTLWFRSGSIGNELNNVIIKNNEIGIIADSLASGINPTLKLSNVQIYNTTTFGLVGRYAYIEADNLVIGNNGTASLACTNGGKYSFRHGTFGNFWSKSLRQFPAVLINNFRISRVNGSDVIITSNLYQADFINCIIDGSQSIEFLLEKVEGTVYKYRFINSLLRFNDVNSKYKGNPLYDFENPELYLNNLFNGKTDFINTGSNDYRIGEKSEALGKADFVTAGQVPL
ncbi:MAG: hypothetical protein U5K51_08380 [Flavobacteriaceae bacterium]|nr:hypothetical protein [Flavobacteriaceae bacterium]